MAKTAATRVTCRFRYFGAAYSGPRSVSESPVPNEMGCGLRGLKAFAIRALNLCGCCWVWCAGVSRLLSGNRCLPFEASELARTLRQMIGDGNNTNLQADPLRVRSVSQRRSV